MRVPGPQVYVFGFLPTGPFCWPQGMSFQFVRFFLRVSIICQVLDKIFSVWGNVKYILWEAVGLYWASVWGPGRLKRALELKFCVIRLKLSCCSDSQRNQERDSRQRSRLVSLVWEGIQAFLSEEGLLPARCFSFQVLWKASRAHLSSEETLADSGRDHEKKPAWLFNYICWSFIF